MPAPEREDVFAGFFIIPIRLKYALTLCIENPQFGPAWFFQVVMQLGYVRNGIGKVWKEGNFFGFATGQGLFGKGSPAIGGIQYPFPAGPISQPFVHKRDGYQAIGNYPSGFLQGPGLPAIAASEYFTIVRDE